MDKDIFPRKEITRALVSKILKQYFDDYQSFSYKLMSAGIENETIVVDFKKSKYVIRIYNRIQFGIFKRKRTNILWELDFMEHLRRGGMPISKIISTKKKQKLITIDLENKKYFVAVFEFIDGRHANKFNPQQIESVIELQAQFHKIAKSFSSSHIRANTYQFGFEKYLLGDLDRKITKYPIHTQMLTELWEISSKNYSKLEKLMSGNKKIAIHNDLNRGNLKFKGNTISGVFDFDDMLLGNPIGELGKTIFFIMDRSLTPKLLMNKIDEAIKHYSNIIKLSKKDIQIVKLSFWVSWASRRFHSFDGKIDEDWKSENCIKFARIYS